MKNVRRLFSLFSISAAILRHEWLPSLCLMTALAAVLSPVVLILGLKHGTVENLRQTLLRDPSNLEIRPRSSLQVDQELIEKIRSIDGSGFIIPKTRSLGSASVEFQIEERRVDVDLFPTAGGDPLLETHHCPQPGADEVVLTSSAAKALSAVGGDEIRMLLGRRTDQGISETVSLTLKVRGVLPPAATTIKAGYVQLSLLSAVEEYRENLAVPRYGWDGPESQQAEPVYDGFLLLADEPLSPESIGRISVVTGFLSHRRVNSEETSPELRRASQAGKESVLFFNDSEPRPEASIRAGENIPGGTGATLLPWCKPREVRVTDSVGKEIGYHIHALMRSDIAPPTGVGPIQPRIIIPDGSSVSGTTVLSAQSPLGMSRIPCTVVSMNEDAPPGIAFVSPSFAGILKHLDSRTVEWDPGGNRFLLGRRNFSGFRLYARDLSSVQPLASRLSEMGIDCTSEGDKVARVLKFDEDLSILFWLVSAFSLAGGGAALALSLYGAIERRRRDYAMLRTLGLPRAWLVLLPLIESLAITTFAFLMALSVYHLNAAVINRLFSHFEDGRPGFCFLPLPLQAVVYLCTLALAVCGALAAAVRLLRMSLSEAIRHV